MAFNTPVLLIVFNRPALTKSVLSALKVAKVKKLFIASDGPRKGNIKDIEACDQIDVMLKAIDWVDELHVLRQPENMGCGRAVHTAIDWFFSQNERGIILEDDCLPSSSFFQFCENALDQFQDTPTIWYIDGSNFAPLMDKNLFTYSGFPLIWGWASWRSRWMNYRYVIKDDEANSIIDRYFQNNIHKKYWRNRMKDFYSNNVDTWDYQWMLTIWKNNGIVVRPPFNLIQNIGFGADGTHTTNSSLKKLSLSAVDFDLKDFTYNSFIQIDLKKDALQFLNRFMRGSYLFQCLFYLRDNYLKK